MEGRKTLIFFISFEQTYRAIDLNRVPESKIQVKWRNWTSIFGTSLIYFATTTQFVPLSYYKFLGLFRIRMNSNITLELMNVWVWQKWSNFFLRFLLFRANCFQSTTSLNGFFFASFLLLFDARAGVNKHANNKTSTKYAK